MAVVRIGLIIVLLLSFGCATAKRVKQQTRGPQASAEEAAVLGQQAYRQIVQQKGGIYPDRKLNAYVNHVGLQLITGQFVPEPEYSFEVVNDSALTSYSMPGGFVLVSRGLLLSLQTEAQLAAVLSHEIGHLTMHHHLQGGGLEGLKHESLDLRAVLSPESEYSDLVASLPKDDTTLVDKKFNHGQEVEADRIGIGLLISSGYHPTAMVDVQRLVQDRLELKVGTEGSDKGLLRHPLSLDRLQTARDFLASHYSQQEGRTGYIEYSEAVEGLQQMGEGYALFDLARRLERQGQVDKAIESYHQALQVTPEESLILAGLGLAYLRNEDPIPALRYLTKAVNLQDNYYQTRLGLGYVYLQKGEYGKAVEQFERSLQLLPTVEAVFLLADAQMKIDQKVKARDLYQIVAGVAAGSKLGKLAESRLEQLAGE